MRGWLSILALMLVVLLGLPTIASAHGLADDGHAGISAGVGSIASDSQQHGAAFFENTSSMPSGHCNGDCCCSGPSHCAPCGPSAFALSQGGHLRIHPTSAGRLGPPRELLPHVIARIFGLERPPRA